MGTETCNLPEDILRSLRFVGSALHNTSPERGFLWHAGRNLMNALDAHWPDLASSILDGRAMTQAEAPETEQLDLTDIGPLDTHGKPGPWRWHLWLRAFAEGKSTLIDGTDRKLFAILADAFERRQEAHEQRIEEGQPRDPAPEEQPVYTCATGKPSPGDSPAQ